ncbi:MAG: U32 family peptidase [Actinomycetota bacterium]|nr:U32 family peptidase [Actinomycetota bacterium]
MGASGAEAGDQVGTGNLHEALAALGRTPAALPDAWVSSRRFGDGAPWRIEIPSVEGPAAFSAVVDEARRCDIRIDRISQGSGISQLSDEALGEMAALGHAEDIETVLWAGARAAWDISAMARSASGASAAGSVRGERGLRAALEEALRAAQAGIDGVLMADVGVLRLLGRAKRAGVLPERFVLKTSIALPTLNVEAAECYVELGATTLNLPTDLPLEDIAAIRRAVDVPLDCYIEGADDFAAPMRYHELAEIVAVAAPVHLKFGLRNVAGTYPAGGHLAGAVIEGSRERVRRAALGVAQLERRGVRRA